MLHGIWLDIIDPKKIKGNFKVPDIFVYYLCKKNIKPNSNGILLL